VAYDPRIRNRDVFYFNEEWENVMGVETLMNIPALGGIWAHVQLDKELNPTFDPGFTQPAWSFDTRGFRYRVVTLGHRTPRLVPPNLWVPGDYVLAEHPQHLFQDEMTRHYYHPFLLLEERPIDIDEARVREALELPEEDSPGERPALKLGPNPKRVTLPKRSRHGAVYSSSIPNPLGPGNFPWAISILTTSGQLPLSGKEWVAGDFFRAEANIQTEALRIKSGNPRISPVSMRDVIWSKLRDRRVFVGSLPKRWQSR